MSTGSLDFGYPWWLNYGHLVILLPAVLLLVIALVLKWRWPVIGLLGLVTVWAAGGLLVLRSFGANQVPDLPTERFFESGSGRVLDIGAGTGRSSIMVLRARPNATLVASDLFGESFEHHFGPGQSPQDRLRSNLRAAGVESRASIETADMKALPFESSTFDAVVSAYAMEHVGRNGSRQALAEAARVLKPGGDFLLILVADDRWTRLAFGPLLAHGGLSGAEWWRGAVAEVGLSVIEEGRKPATLYFLLKRQ